MRRASLRVITPTLVFDRELTLDLPAERILFTGDILVQSPLPYSGASWPVPWIDVLRRLETVPIAAMVPGHGPLMRDDRYTRQVRALLEAVTSRVDSLARRGLTLDQVQAAINLDEVRRATPVWQRSTTRTGSSPSRR